MKEISAGAITYTVINETVYYLLIKDFHGNWGFAKGHLEKGETEQMAAFREIKEEVGIDITLDTDFKEELVYIMPNGKEKHSIYFLGYYENQDIKRQLEEVEETALLEYEKAYELLTFNNMKEVLEKASNYLKDK